MIGGKMRLGLPILLLCVLEPKPEMDFSTPGLVALLAVSQHAAHTAAIVAARVELGDAEYCCRADHQAKHQGCEGYDCRVIVPSQRQGQNEDRQSGHGDQCALAQ